MRAMFPILMTRTLAATLAVALVGISGPAQAQDKQHVVSLSELGKDSALPAATRQAHRAGVPAGEPVRPAALHDRRLAAA